MLLRSKAFSKNLHMSVKVARIGSDCSLPYLCATILLRCHIYEPCQHDRRPGPRVFACAAKYSVLVFYPNIINIPDYSICPRRIDNKLAGHECGGDQGGPDWAGSAGIDHCIFCGLMADYMR